MLAARMPVPPSTRMIQVNLDTEMTRVVDRRRELVPGAPRQLDEPPPLPPYTPPQQPQDAQAGGAPALPPPPAYDF